MHYLMNIYCTDLLIGSPLNIKEIYIIYIHINYFFFIVFKKGDIYMNFTTAMWKGAMYITEYLAHTSQRKCQSFSSVINRLMMAAKYQCNAWQILILPVNRLSW